jgi:hypothetical protein
MTILARFSVGRVLLHLLAMLGDHSARFHFEGIARELPWIASGLAMLTRAPSRLLAALTLYLAQPIKHSITDPSADPQSLAAVLHRGDVLLTQGNSRFAAVIKCLTRSPWSHVSMSVGPLDDGPNPIGVVEADIAAGVRSIRLGAAAAPAMRRSASRILIVRADWVVGQMAATTTCARWGLCKRAAASAAGSISLGARNDTSVPSAFICCSSLATRLRGSIPSPTRRGSV